MNRYRPYYNPRTGYRLGFKPRAYLDEQGALRFLPSALREPVYDKNTLRELAEASREDDFWADFLPRFEFPYSANLIHGARIRLCGANPWIPACDAGGAPSWNGPDVRGIMIALAREFVRICKNNDIVPVLLFFPDRIPRSYAAFVGELRTELSEDGVLVLDFSEAPSYDPSRVRMRPSGGHLSPRGNRLVGEFLAQRLSNLAVLRGGGR